MRCVSALLYKLYFLLRFVCLMFKLMFFNWDKNVHNCDIGLLWELNQPILSSTSDGQQKQTLSSTSAETACKKQSAHLKVQAHFMLQLLLLYVCSVCVRLHVRVLNSTEASEKHFIKSKMADLMSYIKKPEVRMFLCFLLTYSALTEH